MRRNNRPLPRSVCLIRPVLLVSLLLCPPPRLLFPIEGTPGPHTASVWVVRHQLLTSGTIEQAVRDISDAGMSRVFVQVSGRSDSYFPSTILPLSEEIPTGSGLRDPFDEFLDAAREAGIEVHAWVNVLFSWSRPVPPVSREHPFNLHPEWFVYDGEGKSHHACPLDRLQRRGVPGYFLSPAHPGVGNLIRRYLEEIVTRYDIRGIHLDYIRLPSRDASCGWRERTGFERIYYADPLALSADGDPALTDAFGESGVEALRGEWQKFRQGLVTDLVASINEGLDRINPDLVLSAAVFPNPDSSAVQYAQDWKSWLDRDLVDFVVMMSYARSVSDFTETVDHPVVLANADRVVAGISTYNQPVEYALREAEIALEREFAGICFFSYNDLSTKKSDFRSIKRFLKRIP